MSDTGAAASAMMGGSGLHAAVVAAYPAVRAGLRMMLESMPGIGDVRDLSPARLAAGTSMSAEEALHFGLIPRMNRGRSMRRGPAR